MKEHTFYIKLEGGLRPQYPMPPDTQYLVRVENMQSSISGLRTVQKPTTLSPEMELQWPFPQIFRSYNTTLICGKNAVYAIDGTGINLCLDGINAVSSWSCADLSLYTVLSCGNLLLVRDPSSGTLSRYTGDSIPQLGCVESFRGQLLGGNVSGSDYDNGASFVAWSQIGAADFTVNRKNTAGYIPSPFGGTVLAIKSFNEEVGVYGSDGSFTLRPTQTPAPTYGINHTFDLKIAGPQAVAGSKKVHYVVADDGALYKVAPSPSSITGRLEDTYLGYEEFLAPLLRAGINMFYNPDTDLLYICGKSCYFLFNTRTNAFTGPIRQQVSGGTTFINQLTGERGLVIASTDPGTAMVYSGFITDSFDLGIAGYKQLQWVQLHGKIPRNTWVRAHYRYERGEWYTATDWILCGYEGVAPIIIAGTDFRLEVRSTDHIEAARIGVKYKIVDYRFRRGLEGYSGQES